MNKNKQKRIELGTNPQGRVSILYGNIEAINFQINVLSGSSLDESIHRIASLIKTRTEKEEEIEELKNEFPEYFI